MLTLDQFCYPLPTSLIAQSPTHPRDHARLMLINRATSKITHHHIYDLPNLLPAHAHLVVNNTKVFPARLRGRKVTGGHVEVLLTRALGHSAYHCLTRPGTKLGDHLSFGDALHGTITAADPAHEIERTIQFDQEESRLRTLLSELGEMPTPPYIKRLLASNSDYQTIYAKYGFSSAAPTAGLHFTKSLQTTLKTTYSWDEVTLNVGLGTFLPVKVHDITTHPMHREHFTINTRTANHLNGFKAKQEPVLAVGTTTLRTLESAVSLGLLMPGNRDTSIYIYPPYKFQYVDALMTNFHLPESTLLMLVAAFVSYPNTKTRFTTFADSLLGHAYQLAIAQNYRFFSFGDAMLII